MWKFWDIHIRIFNYFLGSRSVTSSFPWEPRLVTSMPEINIKEQAKQNLSPVSQGFVSQSHKKQRIIPLYKFQIKTLQATGCQVTKSFHILILICHLHF